MYNPKWFVVYEGDLNIDPLDKGVSVFDYGQYASDFKSRMENRGLKCKVYFGELSGMFHTEGKHADGCQCERCTNE